MDARVLEVPDGSAFVAVAVFVAAVVPGSASAFGAVFPAAVLAVLAGSAFAAAALVAQW